MPFCIARLFLQCNGIQTFPQAAGRHRKVLGERPKTALPDCGGNSHRLRRLKRDSSAGWETSPTYESEFRQSSKPKLALMGTTIVLTLLLITGVARRICTIPIRPLRLLP